MANNSGKEPEKTKGFFLINASMVDKFDVKESQIDSYNNKLTFDIEIKIPYGVDTSRVAEDFATMIGMAGCIGKVIKHDDKAKQ